MPDVDVQWMAPTIDRVLQDIDPLPVHPGGCRDSRVPNENNMRRMFGKVCGRVLGKKPWWNDIPDAPAVTELLLRRQTHRRWPKEVLKGLLSHLPNLEKLHYEPWPEWYSYWGNEAGKDFPHTNLHLGYWPPALMPCLRCRLHNANQRTSI